MDLNISLWMIGSLFTLSIFAIKVGLGLGFGKINHKGIFITFFIYGILFLVIAILSSELIKILEPLLRRGPYLHAVIAIGLIIWGLFLLKKETQINLSKKKSFTLHSLLLLIPCPVCMTAITFSIWTLLSVIKLPGILIGIGLWVVFALLSLLIVALTRIKESLQPEINLGLCMIGIGIYFLSSLFLPQKIGEAKEVYQTFLSKRISETTGVKESDVIGVILILIFACLIGFFISFRRKPL